MNIFHDVYYLILEKFLHFAIHGKIRSAMLKAFGANIGHGVRINEVALSGLWNGFKNLSIGNNSFVGDSVFIDLTGEVNIGDRTSISPRCTLITHEDPGSMLGSKLSNIYTRKVGAIHIKNDTWIGAGTIILSEVSIGSRVVIGAGSLVNRDIPDKCIAYGRPARVVKEL